ncbi:glycosyltransferase [bacterium]|nr:glycosyltransferase [bacterium]
MNDTPQRVLLLSEIFPPKTGGSGRWFHEIYSRLPREHVVIAAGEDPRAADFDTTHSMHVERLPLTMSEWGIRSWTAAKDYWSLFRQLKSLIRREQISTLHCGRCLPEGWLAFLLKKLCGVPYVSFVHGEDVESASTSRELTWMAQRILSNADFLIANSQNSANLLIDNWNVDASRIRVLHPGVDASRFVPADRDEAVRESLGWKDRTVVLTVGRLQKRKGHDVMIRALPTIKAAVPDILFAVIGDGDERANIEQLTAEHGVGNHVQLLGEVDDATMISCYQQCDLFALPNRQVGRDIEGFGMVLVEAQSCGRPVLAGASGGTRETMCLGETGIVVPCEEPQRLASELISLLCDRDRLGAMGRAARPWVVANLDWNALTEQAAKLLGSPSSVKA